jgi:gamma-glutamylcyclotransferase (GGCT)/AIG2-like uncharacterized protein YtfP
MRSFMMTMEAHNIFVYGTLMRKFENEFAKKLHQNADLIAMGYFRGKLFDLGQYPAAVLCDSTTKIWGEVWHLTDFEKIMPVLDEYEGIYEKNPEYSRHHIPITTESGDIYYCWVYLYNYDTDNLREIEGGKYNFNYPLALLSLGQ